MQTHKPTPTQLRIFTLLALVYGGLTLALLPWSHLPGPRLPQVIAVCNGCIALADICTAALLAREFARDPRPPLLLLACAYVFSGVMALLHLAVFPGALFAQRLFGNPQTTAWLFIFWRLGTGLLFLATVLAARRPALALDRPARKRWVLRAGTASLGAAAAIAAASTTLDVKVVEGTHFTGANISLIVLYQAVCALSIVLIWRGRAFGDMLYLWLALVLGASMTDQLLGSLSGAQYTIGWHAAKASSAVSACLLLVFWLGSTESTERRGVLGGVAAHAAALASVLAAFLLRWFLTPWIGLEYPLATFFGAVAISVWIGGWKPAALAAVAGYFVAMVFFMPPVGELGIARAADVFGSVLYVAVSAIIVGLGDAMRRARDRVRASEELFRRSHEGALQGFALFSPVRDARGAITDLAIRYINRAGAQRSGRPPEALVGTLLSSAFPGAEAAGLAPMLRQVIETGTPRDAELDYRPGGMQAWVRHLAVPMGDGVATSYVDVTDHKRLEAELRQRAEDLQRADANKGRFLALLSHELRNPLAPLANGLALLSMSTDAQMAARTRAMMQRQLEHVRRLIDDLLDVSRIDQGKLQLRRERIALDAAVRSAVETARPGIDAKGHELVVRHAQAPLSVDGDLVRLSQVVANLLNNAAKFTAPGGRIELEMGAEGGEALVRVRDNGVGFEPGEEERIFEMFVQLDEARAQAAGGLGLGLTLVRSIVLMHGGRIEARSAGRGRGAEFCFRLPLAAAGHEDAPAQSPVRARPGSRRVLVVDDNRDAADSLADILRVQGFDVAACYDGEEALAHCRNRRPDVAFVDLDMPGMGGLELARALREELGEATPRLVALTGMGRKSDLEATRDAGFAAHLTKPARLEDVLELAAATAPARAYAPRRSSPAASES